MKETKKSKDYSFIGKIKTTVFLNHRAFRAQSIQNCLFVLFETKDTQFNLKHLTIICKF